MMVSYENYDLDRKFLAVFDVAGRHCIEHGRVVVVGDCRPRTGARATRLPVPFARVEGNFDCSGLGLTTMEGAPSYVADDLLCMDNALQTLGPDPIWVGGDVHAQGNPLDFSRPPFVIGSQIGRIFCSPTRISDSPHDLALILGNLNGPWLRAMSIRDGVLLEYHPKLGLLGLCGLGAPGAGLQGRVLLFNCPPLLSDLLEKYVAVAAQSINRAILKLQADLIKHGFTFNAR